ncbi:Transcriptional regulator [Hahella chejuensis KCTC 2396]|uniref:Transcriptional regulator n=1 Tax=Hahella chejuensis (strain KCTC 2396) TaxID=349521 RepID=Q2SE97_HAHCH|nr:LysR substrate-binding domain-containing protein [Hahella chejuensis]ABC31027.1 Transcriptional regulator [Hahella chejuensis KCTC 2396]
MPIRPRKLPPLNALKAFEASARLLSFSVAALELNVTQGAVSKQIKLLEEYFEQPLFLRRARHIKLTEAGEKLFHSLGDIFDQLVKACDAASSHQKNILRLQVTPSLAVRWLFPRLPQLQRELKDVQLKITTMWLSAEKEADLDLDHYDIVLHCGRRRDNGSANLLREEQLAPVCHPSLLEQHGGDWRRLIRHLPLLHPSVTHEDWRNWLTKNPVPGVDPSSGLIFDTLDMPVTVAMQGHGVALADPLFIMDELKNGILTTPRNHSHDSGWGYYFVHQKLRASDPSILTFKRWLIAGLQEDMERLETIRLLPSLTPLGK